MKKTTLKLYVWENVLTDYTSGIAIAFAASPLEAWEKLKETDHTAWWVLQGSPENRHAKSSLTAGEQPEEIKNIAAFAVWGGG